ncbi:hypothetical protein MSU_0175 [Mycoplasma suis str. Illinois]|uniref:Uncharacterized protein n=1 Tax=Mycoplasma suis (strain Illinois) TaxID=768700 RepID=F0QQE9_MYCSL|nr:hypothetical protein MSU_0175 [Mycoplasma suis str. Illinois]
MGKEDLSFSESSISSNKSESQPLNNLSLKENSINVEDSSVPLFGNELNLGGESKEVISEIYSESKKNVRAKEIEVKSAQKLEESQKTLTPFSENFNSALSVFKKWQKEKEKISKEPQARSTNSRGRRDVEPQISEKLNLEQRKALFNFYKEFCVIKSKQSEYSEDLQKTEKGEDIVGGKERVFISKDEVVWALNQIGWNANEKVTFGKWLKLENLQNGEKDPFSILLEAEYLKKIREKLKTWGEKIEVFKKSQRSSQLSSWGGRNYQRYFEPNLSILTGVGDSLEEEMTLEIAKRLIEQMPLSEISKFT